MRMIGQEPLGGEGEHLIVVAGCGDVVDDGCAGVEGGAGDGGRVVVDREEAVVRPCRGRGFWNDREHAGDLFFGGGCGRSRGGWIHRLRPVICAGAEHGFGVGDGGGRVVGVAAAVGKNYRAVTFSTPMTSGGRRGINKPAVSKSVEGHCHHYVRSVTRRYQNVGDRKIVESSGGDRFHLGDRLDFGNGNGANVLVAERGGIRRCRRRRGRCRNWHESKQRRAVGGPTVEE